VHRVFTRDVRLNRPWEKEMEEVVLHGKKGMVPKKVLTLSLSK
jgi:hypothetical protein